MVSVLPLSTSAGRRIKDGPFREVYQKLTSAPYIMMGLCNKCEQTDVAKSDGFLLPYDAYFQELSSIQVD